MNLMDEFLAGVGNAITDIREKVVEEPWFGRAVTDGPDKQTAWQQQVEKVEPKGPEPDVNINDALGMDR